MQETSYFISVEPKINTKKDKKKVAFHYKNGPANLPDFKI